MIKQEAAGVEVLLAATLIKTNGMKNGITNSMKHGMTNGMKHGMASSMNGMNGMTDDHNDDDNIEVFF